VRFRTLPSVGVAAAMVLAGVGVVPSMANAASPPKIHLVLTMWGSTLDTHTYQERADGFTKTHPNVTVTVKNIAGNYDQTVETMIAGGDSPDVMECAQDCIAFGAKGATLNLDPYIKASHLNHVTRYVPGFWAAYRYHGDQYALPDRGGYIMMYYNKTMFNKAHVPYPTDSWTLQNVVAAAKKLTIVQNGKTVQWGFADGQWWPEYYGFMHAYGGHVLNANETKATLDTPGDIKGLELWNQLIYKDKVTPSNKEYANMGADMSPDLLFGEGKAAMMITGFWDVATFVSDHLNFGIAPLPVGTNNKVAVNAGSGLAIASQSKYPKVDWELINYMTSAAGEKPIVTNKEDLPAALGDVSYYASTLPKGLSYKPFESQLDRIFSPRIPPSWDQINTDLNNDLTPYFDDTESLQAAIKKADSQIDSVLAGNTAG
jgi:multiple sugar transport system substrate-binding protein